MTVYEVIGFDPMENHCPEYSAGMYASRAAAEAYAKQHARPPGSYGDGYPKVVAHEVQ